MLELDIIVPENYILPLQNYFLYVPGSAKANLYISGTVLRDCSSRMLSRCAWRIGDVAGPYFWEGDSVLTSDNLIYKTVAPADGALVGFMTMIYNIIYLRQGHGSRGFDQNKLTGLLTHANIGKIHPEDSPMHRSSDAVEYQRLMAFYFNDQSDMGVHDGAFSNFGWKNETSVWLTSWVLISLSDATQAEWEDYNLYIDHNVRAQSSTWILTKQDADGSWTEHSNVLDREKFQVIMAIEENPRWPSLLRDLVSPAFTRNRSASEYGIDSTSSDRPEDEHRC